MTRAPEDIIRVFVGYDAREAIAYSVLAHSINRRANRPVAVAPLMLSQLGKHMWRGRHPPQCTACACPPSLASARLALIHT